jgi:DNA-directed RNA polymerase subunit RPC12/RpoP
MDIYVIMDNRLKGCGMMIKAVIFDLFETLITEWGHEKYTKRKISDDLHLNYELFSKFWEENAYGRYQGNISFEESIGYVCKKCGVTLLPDQLALVQIGWAAHERFVELYDGPGEAERLVGGPHDRLTHDASHGSLVFAVAGIDAVHGVAARREQAGIGKRGKVAAAERQHLGTIENAAQPEVACPTCGDKGARRLVSAFASIGLGSSPASGLGSSASGCAPSGGG